MHWWDLHTWVPPPLSRLVSECWHGSEERGNGILGFRQTDRLPRSLVIPPRKNKLSSALKPFQVSMKSQRVALWSANGGVAAFQPAISPHYCLWALISTHVWFVQWTDHPNQLPPCSAKNSLSISFYSYTPLSGTKPYPSTRPHASHIYNPHN